MTTIDLSFPPVDEGGSHADYPPTLIFTSAINASRSAAGTFKKRISGQAILYNPSGEFRIRRRSNDVSALVTCINKGGLRKIKNLGAPTIR